MKTISVVAAIIKATNEKGEPIIYATQRGYGDFNGGLEFPGDKIEAGEIPEEALMREIREELDKEISVDSLLETVEYGYPIFHLSMKCYWSSVAFGRHRANKKDIGNDVIARGAIGQAITK